MSLCRRRALPGMYLTKTATGREWAASTGGVGGGGSFSRTELGTLTTPTTAGDISPITLSEPITSGNIIEITIDPTAANDGAIEYVSFISDAWLGLAAQATEPGTGDTQVAIGFKVTRGNDDQTTDSGAGSIYIWRGSTDSQLYFADRAVARPGTPPAAVTVYQANLGAPERAPRERAAPGAALQRDRSGRGGRDGWH